MEVKLISISKGVGEFEGKSAEEIMVYAARVSSSRADKFDKPEGLLEYCIKHKHWSIFEQATMTISITASKAIGIQILRHRSFSFQEFSQRYAKVEEFEPFELRKQAEKNRQSSTEVFDPEINVDCGNDFVPHDKASLAIQDYLQYSQNLYNALLDVGVAKECARMVLPMCTQTTIYMTGSIRSWIHFLDIRDDVHAQMEIQLIAKEIKRIFIEQLPIISKALNYTV